MATMTDLEKLQSLSEELEMLDRECCHACNQRWSNCRFVKLSTKRDLKAAEYFEQARKMRLIS